MTGKVGEVIGEKVSTLGVKDADVIIKGVGSGREPAVRSLWLLVSKLIL